MVCGPLERAEFGPCEGRVVEPISIADARCAIRESFSHAHNAPGPGTRGRCAAPRFHLEGTLMRIKPSVSDSAIIVDNGVKLRQLLR